MLTMIGVNSSKVIWGTTKLALIFTSRQMIYIRKLSNLQCGEQKVRTFGSKRIGRLDTVSDRQRVLIKSKKQMFCLDFYLKVLKKLTNIYSGTKYRPANPNLKKTLSDYPY